MGSWGTGLYQNDTASDVEFVFGDLSRRPMDTDTLVSQVLEKFVISLTSNDDDSVDVILSLAAPVQQYTFHMSASEEDKTGVMIFEGRLWKRLKGIKQWPAVKLGSAVFDAIRVRQMQDKSSYNARDADGIRWLEDDLLKSSFHKDALNARTGLSFEINPHPTLRLSHLATAA